MELHSRTMAVRSITEVDADNVRVELREINGPGGSSPMPGMGMSAFSFNVLREDAPEILDELTVTVNSAAS